MSRDFVGTGHSAPERYDVHVEENDNQRLLTQQVGGVHTNFEWDGAGAGSNDVARALLWMTTGVEPAWQIYRLFKSEVVSAWPRKVGECWRISDREISRWLESVERDTAASENADQTKARLAQTDARELKVKGFAYMFKKHR